MTFAEALRLEETNMVDVRNVSVFDCPKHATMMGPTKVWMTCLDKKTNIIPTKEIKLLREWKEFDNRRYSNQTQLGFWD